MIFNNQGAYLPVQSITRCRYPNCIQSNLVITNSEHLCLKGPAPGSHKLFTVTSGTYPNKHQVCLSWVGDAIPRWTFVVKRVFLSVLLESVQLFSCVFLNMATPTSRLCLFQKLVIYNSLQDSLQDSSNNIKLIPSIRLILPSLF